MTDKPRRTGRLGGIELLAQEIADDAHRSVMESFDLAVGDSPIERLFITALSVVADQRHRSIEAIYILKASDDLAQFQDIAETAGENGSAAFCQSQVKLAGWRVDFVLHYPDIEVSRWSLKKLLIECDGHDFHERTKEQAKRDRSRDRAAQYEGLPILRFTGSEIWNDPYGVADEVLAFMERH